MKIKFWGVRGSVPSPLTPAQVAAYEGLEIIL